MNTSIAAKLLRVALLASLTTLARAASPAISFSAVPSASNENSVIWPYAVAQKTTYDVASIEMWYSWDDATWTEVNLNSSPNNSGAGLYLYGDQVGGEIDLSQTGTLYLMATATDTDSQSTTIYASVTSNSSASDLPSVMGAIPLTYNYGPAWMWDTSLSTSEIWWTAGSGYGDTIVHSTWPIGGSAAQTCLDESSFGGNLLSNPCVIKAAFGNGYSYAMYYTEAPGSTLVSPYTATGPGDIAVAFSNDGVTWTGQTPVVNTQFTITDYSGFVGAAYSSVIRLSSSSYIMFYMDYPQTGSPSFFTTTSSDGITWSGTPSSPSTSGLSNFGAAGGEGVAPYVAYDTSNDCYYMAYSETSNGEQIDVYKIASSDLYTGSWTEVATIPSSSTMSVKNNPGLLRDESGFIPSGFDIFTAYSTENSLSNNGILQSELYYSEASP